MRTKAVPEPASMDALIDAQRAVPLVPKPTADCCARVHARGPAETRDAAREWLAFLEVLDLVAETERGYERRRVDPDEEPLAERFRERVYGAQEVLDALGQGPLTPTEAFESTRSIVPAWERNRHQNWGESWRDRTERLLRWAAIFGLVDSDGKRYHVA